MKNFIIKCGRKILDISVYTSIGFSLLIVLAGIFISNKDNYGLPFLVALMSAFSIIITTIVSSFVLYLLIDIRDLLNKASEEKEVVRDYKELSKENYITCSKCKTKYVETENFCPNCNTSVYG